jgi:hypothetical protein
MDLVDLTKEITQFNRETLPLLQGILDKFVKDLHGVVDRLNNATVTSVLTIPERKP